jgi:mono/diheme cytochrome c family protein
MRAVIVACLLAGLPAVGASQERTTMSGVFDVAQAARGQELYGGLCRSCHTSASHTPGFKAAWTGRPLAELFEFVAENMPRDNPGTLTAEENAELLAYMLRALGMPAGRTALPSDLASLGRIRFDTLAVTTGTTPGEGTP